MRRRRRHASRTAQLGKTSLELDVEAAVQDRVDSAVQKSQGLGEGVDGFGDDVLVLRPDVDQVDHEIRSPATDERADDTQCHLNRTDTVIFIHVITVSN